MKMNFLRKRIYQFKEGIERFPESIGIAFLFALFLVITVEADSNDDFYQNMNMALVVTLLAVTDGLLIAERLKKKIRYLTDALGLLFGVIIYFIIPESVDAEFMTFYFSLVGNLCIWFLLIPYVFARKGFGFYSLKVALRGFVSLLYGLVLFAGVSALVFAVESLFEVEFSEMIYLEVLIVSMVFVAISHFLSTIPSSDDDWSYDQYPKVIHILLTMIVIPLILAFTLIIYAYFLRILVTFTWPKGLVGQLVIWFGLAAWMTLFLLDELILTKKWQITWKKIFPYTFILPVVMLFIAIGIRINQHGITQLRYYVVLGGIWFSINILATLFVSRYKNMIYAISGSVLLLVASLGPLSSVNMSFRSQEGIIMQILEAEGLLVSGQLVEKAQADSTLSEGDNRTLYSALYYLEDIGKLEDVAFLDADFDLSRDYEAAFGSPIVSPRYMGDYRYLESIQETSIYVEGGYVIPFYRYNSFIDLPAGNFLVSLDEKGIEINGFDGNQVFLVTYETMAEILETRNLADGRNYEAEDLRLEFNEKSIKVIIQIYRFNYNREDMDIDQAEGLIIIEENR